MLYRGLTTGTFLFLAGCAGQSVPEPKISHLDADQMISHSSSMSGTIIVTPGDRRYICSQPAPDSGFTQGDSGGFSLAILASQSDAVSESENMAEVELAGRSPGILLARELLYRLCEFGHNNALSKDEAKALYKRNLDIIEKISSIEAGNTTIKIDDALTTNDEVGTQGASGNAATDKQPASSKTQSSDNSSTDEQCEEDPDSEGC